ncbi:hypothetical protein TCAL_12181 [Tigriopus californicus]|uniref:Transmembrane protein 245 n=1 Tax=Tigriopus californicus TaxID=6832 RepID=A0A553PML2_TIGCA|nr:transmembrane protein 245-like [Tigriopus californicus]TRY78928.1 hypothetical protein TCAL_12181 [Tigriopus californicus]|eukprot:TCALIF_12181-PA protein Name:"Similar to Tmem245 Transmembrane protein 245 (Rattus norvegicus)" AED:0.01 eAED:0.01 QI:0/-1/0/1/-1/1/1/0/859
MSSMEGGGGVAASPLDNFLHYVPKSHEAALRQAIYNGLVFIFLAIVLMASYYGLVVMKPFLYAIFWAVLAGFVLHPYKAWLTRRVLLTLDQAQPSGLPLSFRCGLGGARRLLAACDATGSFILSKLPVIVALGLAWPLFLYLTSLPLSAWGDSFSTLGDWLAWIFGLAERIPIVYTLILALAYLAGTHALAVNVSPVFGLVFWSMIVSQLVNALGVFLSSLMALVLLLRFFFPPQGEDVSDSEHASASSLSTRVGRFRSAVRSFIQTKREEPGDKESPPEEDPPPATPLPSVVEPTAAAPAPGSQVKVLPHQKVDCLKVETPISSHRPTQKKTRVRVGTASKASENLFEAESTIYIKSVFWCCVYIQFYLRPGLLLLLPLPLLIYIVKELLIYFELMSQLEDLVKHVTGKLREWIKSREQHLIPLPIRTLYRLFLQVEDTLVDALPNYIDQLISAGLIVFLLVSTVGIIVLFSFEIYSEGVHIFHMSSQFLGTLGNSSLVQHINGTILGNSPLNLEDLFESGYLSGRKYLSSTIRDLIQTGNETEAEELELQVLELWDRMYQYWQSKGSEEMGPQVSNEAIKSSFEDLYYGIMQQKWMSLATITQFSRENMGIITTVVEQTWLIVQSNLGLTLSGLGAVARVLLSSGSNLVNILMNFIVFLSALFYLLVYSGKVYMPLEVLSNVGHTLGKGFGDSLNNTVNGVFKVTIKMACFYGLWTYLTHTVFHASIVAIPVIVATFLAAVPLAGQYLVSFPAALELVLNERYLSAMGLILCHILPMWVVDAAIYSEIRRVIHPWLTGLSIVGGVYYFGFDGAIYGPLILCAVIVTISMYTNILQELPRAERRSSMGFPIRRSESIF